MFCNKTDWLFPMPDIPIYVNCDNPLAINIKLFNLKASDELIFTIKNYDYIDSSYIFSFKARLGDENANGDVLFNVPSDVTKYLKPGAFYNFSVLSNAFELNKDTEYHKLTANGKLLLRYGAQDLSISQNHEENLTDEIVSMRLEPLE